MIIFKRFDVIFFCSSPIDEIWVRSTIQLLSLQTARICLVIYGEVPEDISVLYRATPVKLVQLNDIHHLARYKSKVVVSASTNLQKEYFSKKIQYFIHMPHSLVSLHSVYPCDAFDTFNCLFAAGEHHVQEFQEIIKIRGKAETLVYPVGYGKLDELLRDSRCNEKPQKDHVLIAPSWGNHNIIETIGFELAEKLLKEGFRVTLRPHPMFFLDKQKELQPFTMMKHDNFVIEHPSDCFDSLYTSQVLVTDYSGISLEYYGIRKRKMIFVEVPPKIFNSEFERYSLPPFEVTHRNTYGKVVSPTVKDAYNAIINKQSDFVDIEESAIFNPGKCAPVAVNKIMGLLSA